MVYHDIVIDEAVGKSNFTSPPVKDRLQFTALQLVAAGVLGIVVTDAFLSHEHEDDEGARRHPKVALVSTMTTEDRLISTESWSGITKG